MAGLHVNPGLLPHLSVIGSIDSTTLLLEALMLLVVSLIIEWFRSGATQLPAFTWAHPFRKKSANSEWVSPMPLFPWDGSGSGAQNFEIAPCPYCTTYYHRHVLDLLLLPGPSNLGNDTYFLGPLVLQYGQFLRRLRALYILLAVAAQLDRLYQITSQRCKEIIGESCSPSEFLELKGWRPVNPSFDVHNARNSVL